MFSPYPRPDGEDGPVTPYLRSDGGDAPVTPYLRADGGDVPVTLKVAGYTTPDPGIPDPGIPDPGTPTPEDNPIDTLLTNLPFYVAHRLGGTEYPEHTMQGMTAAINAGFTAFEFSTYRTRDGVFIGSHDWTTERTTGQYHEIWDTDWSTIQTLTQPAGPIIRLEDAVAAMPEDSVLVLDHKATSARSDFHAGDRASESELFDLLDTLFDVPQDRVIWKLFVDSNSDQRAAERGYKTMCMLYPSEVADANLNRWDILGMAWNAPKGAWDTLLATGKPTIAHIIVNPGQAATSLSQGAHGLMSSVPSIVHP